MLDHITELLTAHLWLLMLLLLLRAWRTVVLHFSLLIIILCTHSYTDWLNVTHYQTKHFLKLVCEP